MQLLIVFATIFAVSLASPYGGGGINNAVQTSNARAGQLGTAISSGNALAGNAGGLGAGRLGSLGGLGTINNARQNSNAVAGAGGVAVATGTATAGNGRVVKRAVAMIVGGPKAGEYVAI